MAGRAKPQAAGVRMVANVDGSCCEALGARTVCNYWGVGAAVATLASGACDQDSMFW